MLSWTHVVQFFEKARSGKPDFGRFTRFDLRPAFSRTISLASSIFDTTAFSCVLYFKSAPLASRDGGYAKDWRMLLIANLFMLVVIPLALYLPIQVFSHEWAVAFLILGAMPTGMTIALIADFFGGKTSLALLITATTSLLAPFTIPLIFKIAIGRLIPIPVLPMFLSLFVTIILPFIGAMLTKQAVPVFVKKHDQHIQKISVLAFGILITGIVADTSNATLITLSGKEVLLVVLGMIWLGILTLVSYDLVKWRTISERLTIALCMIYLNNTLSLFIADRFFHEQNIVPKLLLLLLVVNVLLPPIKWFARSITQPGVKS